MVSSIQPEHIAGMLGTSSAIRDLVRFPRSPLDLPLHVVTARLQDKFELGLSESVARCPATGVSQDDPSLAVAAAIGEAWERIGFVQQHQKLLHAPTFKGSTAMSVADLLELPFLLDKGVERREWAQKAETSPQAKLEYLRYDYGKPPRSSLLPAYVRVPGAPSTLFETTNGLACAHNFDVAIDRAVREVVERDALMLVWLTRCGGSRVSPSVYLSAQQNRQIARLSDMQIQFRLRDISTEFGIRVFLAIIFASFPNKRIGIAFGAGAHRVPHLAASHAFREAGLSWRGVVWRSLVGERPEKEQPSPASFAEHAEYYSNWDRMHLLDFLLADDEIEQRDDAAHLVDQDCDSAFADQGHVDLMLEHKRTVFTTDITPQESQGTGLTVAQAVVPGLVPLYIGDRCADEIAMNRLPANIGGISGVQPKRLNEGVHPWP